MKNPASTIDKSIRTNDELYYYWYYWLKDPNIFSSEKAMKLKEFLESNYDESHTRSLKDDMINLERKEEILIRLLLEIPEVHYGIGINDIKQKTLDSSSPHEYDPYESQTPQEIARHFVKPIWNPDFIRESTMKLVHSVRPRPELEHLTEFVEALKRIKEAADEELILLEKLPRWARQVVDIIRESGEIEHYDLLKRLEENGLPDSYKHISKLFYDDGKKYYDKYIIRHSGYFKLKYTEITPPKSQV